MVQLADIQEQAKELSEEDRKGLVAYLLHGMSGLPSGPNDEEVGRREAEKNASPSNNQEGEVVAPNGP